MSTRSLTARGSMSRSTLVFGELDWSPGPHKQAIERPRRPGQTKRVRAYFCTTDDGSDPVMLETLDVKSRQSQGAYRRRRRLRCPAAARKDDA